MREPERHHDGQVERSLPQPFAIRLTGDAGLMNVSERV
jgi:hypothetical protein